MNENVRQLGAVPKIDHAELIASGLESLAKDIRAGKLPIAPVRALVTMSGRGADADDVCSLFYGGESSLAETVGMLELAKLTAIEESAG